MVPGLKGPWGAEDCRSLSRQKELSHRSVLRTSACAALRRDALSFPGLMRCCVCAWHSKELAFHHPPVMGCTPAHLVFYHAR
jgi:hypothetical protein